MSYQHIAVEKLSGACGAVISGIDLAEDIDEQRLGEVKRAFHENLVIFFRDQDMTEEQHKAFGRRFGTLNIHPRYEPLEGHPEIFPIRKDPEHKRIVGEVWHQDLTHLEKPPLGSILHGKIIPGGGKGDTEFLSLAAAYDALDKDMRDKLQTLEAEHSFEYGFKESLAKPGGRERLAKALEDNPPVTHPVVRTHPVSGREALFVNGLFTTRILGMPREESDALLEFLYEHMEQPRFRCRFAWRPDSIAFWDNRACQHYGSGDFWPYRRVGHRVTLSGDKPFYDPKVGDDAPKMVDLVESSKTAKAAVTSAKL